MSEFSTQPLSEFASEAVPPPATNAIDALIDAVSVGERPAESMESSRATTPPKVTPDTRWPLGWVTLFQPAFFQPVFLRWAAISAVAFGLGVIVSLGALYILDPVPGPMLQKAAAPVQPPPVMSPQSDRPSVPAPSTVPPAVLPVTPPLPRTSNGAAVPGTTASIGALDRPAPRTARLEDNARAGAVNTPSRSEVIPDRRLPAVVTPTPPAMVTPPATVSTPPVAETLASATSVVPADAVPSPIVEKPRAILDEDEVLKALRHYEEAYEELDVEATAEVWPWADRRALTRAFSTLKSVGLVFDRCEVSVTESRATARCHGTLNFVRKIGSPSPRSEPQEWLFRMRKLGSDWKIEDVTASPVAAAPRVARREP